VVKVIASLGITPPTEELVEKNFFKKYGTPENLGPGPAMRRKYGYYTPDDYYESLVDCLLNAGEKWLDVGCGRRLFPSNEMLSRELSARAGVLVGVDPDITLEENPYVHEKARVPMDEFRTQHKFDLITMRMVAEHVDNPDALLSSIAECTHAGSRVVVYTINRWSPVPMITNLVPFKLYYPAKKLLWGSQSKDTFPTTDKMNTQEALIQLFSRFGFDEGFLRTSMTAEHSGSIVRDWRLN
jgi:SAM-dependent methyltransferase